MQGNKRRGILAGGNWIHDQVKIIDIYPEEEKLSNILKEYTGKGGAPFNVLTALHKMKASFALEGVGVVGEDDKGDEILQECQNMRISTSQIKRLEAASTSYTDVMTVTSTGKRTFFHSRGANALLDESYFDFTLTEARIFHLGYLLLLDSLDEVRSDGLTGAAKVFKKAKKAGLTTSADIVSEQSNRFKKIVSSSLPFIDILFLNEYEATMLTGIKIVSNGVFCMENAQKAAQYILKMGVRNWVIIHFSHGAIALNNKGHEISQQAINLPADRIKGAVGAGDAFAAGVLYGMHEDWGIGKSLNLGVCVAAASMMDVTSTACIKTWQECLKFGKKYGYRDE